MEMIAENSRLFEREWLSHLGETVLGTLCVTLMCNQELDVESTVAESRWARVQSRAKVNSQLMWYCTDSKVRNDIHVVCGCGCSFLAYYVDR
jgi:hypothetical protein